MPPADSPSASGRAGSSAAAATGSADGGGSTRVAGEAGAGAKRSRVELNRAAQARFRQKRKARLAELEGAGAAAAAVAAERDALLREVERLKRGGAVAADDDGDITPSPPLSPATASLWARLLPRLVPSDWDATPPPLLRQLDSAAAARTAAGLAGAPPPAPPAVPAAAVSITVPVEERWGGVSGGTRVASAEEILRWPWRTHLALYRACASECARTLPLAAAGDERAACEAVTAARRLRAALTALGVADPRRASLLMLSDVRTLGLPTDGDGRAAAAAAAAALAAALTLHQRAAVAAASSAHSAAIDAARARRAALVPLACGEGGELRALEAQGLLKANLDEDVAAAACLTHAILATILTPAQVAAAVGAAYPAGLDVAAAARALCGGGRGGRGGRGVDSAPSPGVGVGLLLGDEPFDALL